MMYMAGYTDGLHVHSPLANVTANAPAQESPFLPQPSLTAL
jgi:hypothetical protein